MITRVGFIGLGNLGRAIAQRLISQGRELVVWNRTAAKADGLGAITAKSPAEVINQSAVTFLCLFNSDSVESVLSGPNGLLSGDCRGKIVCDITTNHFETVNASTQWLRGGVGHIWKFQCSVASYRRCRAT